MARGKAIDAGWAAFNIETDGNQFDFKVALGATVVGFREPDRSEIEELRAEANQYWGLKGSTEERIHSARWGAGAT